MKLEYMDTHFFNEKTKRLEPLDNVCVFCGRRHVNDADDTCYMPLYKENSRLNVIVYRNVKFSKIVIGAPRCSSCRQIHSRVKIRSILYSVVAFTLGLILIFLLPYFLYHYIKGIAYVIGAVMLFADIVLIIKAYDYFERRLIRSYDILTPKEGLQVYPIVRELLDDGFTFDSPVA